MDYRARKAARVAAFEARKGVSQPRRVIRVYADSVIDINLPLRFKTLAVGAFASHKEAQEFVRDTGPGTNFGSAAMKALFRMISREESMRMLDGADKYIRFDVRSEEISS